MQTFLTHPDFKTSFEVLDDKRLGKQRVETFQILNSILGRPKKDGTPYKGWTNHPCCVMWRDYVNALKLYHNLCIDEWVKRGRNNTMLHEVIEGDIVMPICLGFEDFHSSHRANLLRKDTEFYGKYNWKENPEDPYVWMDKEGRWYKQTAGKPIKTYYDTIHSNSSSIQTSAWNKSTSSTIQRRQMPRLAYN